MTRDEVRDAMKAAPPSRRLAVFFAISDFRQGDIAERAGLAEPVFSRIVSGRRPATPEQRDAIGKALAALGYDVSDLLVEAA